MKTPFESVIILLTLALGCCKKKRVARHEIELCTPGIQYTLGSREPARPITRRLDIRRLGRLTRHHTRYPAHRLTRPFELSYITNGILLRKLHLILTTYAIGMMCNPILLWGLTVI